MDVVWCWLEQHEMAFKTVKQYLAKAPVLRYYVVSEEVTIQCDACGTGLGAVLLQKEQPMPRELLLIRKLENQQNYTLNLQYKKGALMRISDTLWKAYRRTTESAQHDTSVV